MPAALMAAAAAGEVRNLNSALAASSGGVVMGVRLGGEGRALSPWGGPDAGLRPPRATRHATRDAGGVQPVPRCDLALLHEVIYSGAGHDDIHDLTVDDAPHDLGGGRENQRDFVATTAFERACEFGQHVVHRSGCQHLDFGGIGRSRCSQSDGETDHRHNPREIQQSSTAGEFHGALLWIARDTSVCDRLTANAGKASGWWPLTRRKEGVLVCCASEGCCGGKESG